MSRNIDFISDLHMEINGNCQDDLEWPEGNTTRDILILGGDTLCYRHFDPKRTDAESRGLRRRFDRFLSEKCQNYDLIVFIPGNHEYYGYHVEGADAEFQERMRMYDDRLFVMNNNIFHDHDFILVGATFWTGFSAPSDRDWET